MTTQPGLYIPPIDPRLAPQPGPIPGQGLAGVAHRISLGNQGLGKALFANQTPGADPAAVAQQQRLALLSMGLGMLAGNERGQGFGQATLGGLTGAQNQFNEAMQTAYRNRLTSKGDERRDKLLERDESRYQWQKEHGLEREAIEDRRTAADRQLAQRAAERADKVAGAQVGSAGASARAAGVGADKDALAIEQMRKNQARLQELLAKPEKTPAELEELNILAGGSPQGLIGAQARDPFAGLGMMGFPGMMGVPGQSGNTNPLLNDPDF